MASGRSSLLAAVTTLAGASLAAFFHDDLRHAVGYLVIADAGLLLLAIAALDPDAWGPGRAWVVALAASKTALGAWAAVTEDRFETRSLPELRGWMRRSPLLSAALVITAVATFGLPGWVALQARADLATGVWGSPWSELLLLAGFLTLPTYLRFASLGLGRVTSRVDRAAPERIVRRRKPLESLRVEQEGPEGTTLVGGETATGPAVVATSVARSAAAGARVGLDRAVAVTRGAAASARGALARRPSGADVAGDSAPGSGMPMPDDARTTTDAQPAEAIEAIELREQTGAASPSSAAPTATSASSRPRTRARTSLPGARARASAAGARFAGLLRRDRTELLSGAVLALAILAALTSWGVLDLSRAAAEPAPIIVSGTTD